MTKQEGKALNAKREEISRRNFIRLPMEERRRILNEQAINYVGNELIDGIAFVLFQFDGGTWEHWETDFKAQKEYCYRARLMASFLHSHGLVIKVEGELPDTYTSELGEYGAVILGDGTYLEVVPVEPLIGGKDAT